LTNADWLNWYEGNVVSPNFKNPIAAPYTSIRDMLVQDVQCVGGLSNRLLIPAPLLSWFSVDQQTVNTASAPYIALRAVCFVNIAIPLYCLPILAFNEGCLIRRAPAATETFQVGGAFSLNGFTLVWLDAQGQTCSTRLCGFIGIVGTFPTFDASSNATISQYWGGAITLNTSPSPGFGTYSSVGDYAQIFAADQFGNRTSISIPAPISDMFLSDQETVDDSYPLVQTLYGNMIAELVVPSSGNRVAHIIGGIRRRYNRLVA
jgi:hypothetical protein